MTDAGDSSLDDLIGVVARLRAPGGCSWCGEQTPRSLVTYLIEEAYELVEAIETGDPAGLREELGDVLYQVLFHAELASRDHGFDIHDVAADTAAKMRSRHPQVFDETATDEAGSGEIDADVIARWDALKRAEKPERTSALDGIPPGLPALALADKTLGRAAKAGLVELADGVGLESEEQLGGLLLAIAQAARSRGFDPERALRTAVRDLSREIRDDEDSRRAPS